MADNNVNILAYQYEPEYKDGEESELEDYDGMTGADVISDNIESRSELEKWCRCGNCIIMPTTKERMCCLELDEVKYFKLEGKHDKGKSSTFLPGLFINKEVLRKYGMVYMTFFIVKTTLF